MMISLKQSNIYKERVDDCNYRYMFSNEIVFRGCVRKQYEVNDHSDEPNYGRCSIL